jgi:hypothetical protein
METGEVKKLIADNSAAESDRQDEKRKKGQR